MSQILPRRRVFLLTGGGRLSHEGSVATAALNAQQCGSNFSETDGSRWYCVKTRPKQEFEAWSQLGRQGFRAHLPLYVAKREIVRAPKKTGTFQALVSGKLDEQQDVIRALFPSYLFVRFDRSRDQWRAVASTFGVANLFMSGDFTPTPVARGVVEKLIAKGRPGDGVIDDKYRGPEMPRAPAGENDITPGMAVKITSGPFANIHGLCTMSWQKRNELLIEMLGAQTRVTVDRKDIEVV